MKKLLNLYWTFFKLGIINFGGGYALLPLLQKEFCEKRNWLTNEEIADYYAIGQCTPGAIAVNVSTFVGYKIKGVLGGIVATLGFVSPAFLIIALIASLLTNFADISFVKSAFTAIRVCVFVLVLNAIIKLAKTSIKDIPQLIIAILVLFLSIFIKNIPLYVYIILAGLAGIVICLFKNNKFENGIILNNELKENEIIVEEDNNIKSVAKDVLFYFLGFIDGIFLGLLGYPFNFLIKNKKFKEGYYTTFLLWSLILVLLIIFFINKDNLIFLRLHGEFFKIGICAFGGGLATIPFLKELGELTGWFSIDELANMIAVSESTPGAIGINMSTYVGYKVIANYYLNMPLGYLGGIVSTLGLVTPSILVIIIICQILEKFKNSKGVEWAFYGLRAASIGLIGNAAYSILTLSICNPSNAAIAFNNVGVNKDNFYSKILEAISAWIINFFDYKCLALTLFLGILVFKFKKHPIFYIVISAIIGIIFQF